MKPKSTHEKHRVPVGPLDFGLIVISDTRYREIQTGAKSTDETTAMVSRLIEEAGHKLASVSIVPDEPHSIIKSLNEFVGMGILVIITSGGTGLSPRDITIETITPLFEKRIPGFGELFRFESYRDIGTAAMLTRAEAGTYKGAVIFCLPGSPNAVHTALTSFILPEIEHIISHMKTKISKDSKEEK
ncbi:MAG: molybdenum cofactor biosynthesis protein MoaB [Candidatus Freyarchaeota archaeon]|nr:molybdenum cofactor biosynthesis protein MoaB [Candidatus Jordarchaeia archaeon]MBS7269465.1 molybdenum cofactor biosynthesis protein MoaB [Candidatus Jordarchaeia archaeon]MBS7278766.1 molybdenum cofactor biosynthesis protein MoaB [Candidatus Jordarchaeia archaeon]